MRRLRVGIIVLSAALTLVAAAHALRDKSEPSHEHSAHGALITCVVTLALVGTLLRLVSAPPRLRTRPPTVRRLVFALSPAPATSIVSRPRISSVWLGRFRH